MKIIIVGCGKVGYAIAQQLTQEKHDITVVDDEAAHLNRADSTLDVLCIHGNGASISVLMEAGARDADLVIAVTGVDETNLVCALIAKSVGAQHTIARVRNPEYRRDADMLKREIGLDMVINPDLAAAQLEQLFPYLRHTDGVDRPRGAGSGAGCDGAAFPIHCRAAAAGCVLVLSGGDTPHAAYTG